MVPQIGNRTNRCVGERDTPTCILCLQSADITAAESKAPLSSNSEHTKQEVVQFLDENKGKEVGMSFVDDPVTRSDFTRNVELAEFLSRPVRIANFTWLETDSVGTVRSYNPWYLFFNDTRIKYKLNNYSFMRCNLKIKVMINASPFYYGAMIMNYQPLQNFTPSTIVNDAGTRWFIPQSQRPRLWIFPQNNEGGVMECPYFNFRNWIPIQTASNLTDLGVLNFINYTVLASANGVSSAGVTVQVYAWAEDVEVSGPSVGLCMQCDDEYGNGKVSAPASAIAAFAGNFENMPIIGRFATATRIGASAVSSIASLFGWTNVPVISNTNPFRPSPFPQLSSPEISYPVEKLTIDPKNELSVDPRIVGLDGSDELAINYLANKESYLTTTSWATTNNVDDILFSSVVSPMLFDNDNATQAKVYMTPICWVSQLFQSWRGDIIFRFRFVCSQYHKGRVRISYDPTGYASENIISDSVSSSVVSTQIIDLGKDTDVELRIPYQQAISWLLTQQGLSASNIYWSTSLTPTFNYNSGFHNGTITVRVLNALTAPVSSSTISMMVFVRAADNFELANPTSPPKGYSMFAVQSDDSIEPLMLVAGEISRPDENRYLVNYGENIKSLRQLMRRHMLNYVSTVDSTAVVTSDYIYQSFMSKWPLPFGYDPTGVHSAKGLTVPLSNFPFNFALPSFHSWISPAYIAQRGSMIWTFNVDGGGDVGSIRCIRFNSGGFTVQNTSQTNVRGTVSANSRFFYGNCDAGGAGSALTNQNTQAGLSVLLPNMSPYRFQSTKPSNITSPSSADASDKDILELEVTYNNSLSSLGVDATSSRIWRYNSIGTDYNLFYFLNVPVLYRYSALPNAN